MDRERLKGNLDLLLPSVLSSGPAHGYAVLGWAARAAWRPAARPGPVRAGVVGMSEAGCDLIAGYLDQMRAGLRVPAAQAELILAEAEDHLCETAAAGREVGMTERAAQEAAISSFGPVRAVVRAHHARRGRLAAAAEAGLAAWKLAAVLLLTSGVTALAIGTILWIWPPVVPVTPGSQTPRWPWAAIQRHADVSAVVINPVWRAWAVAAVGGAILLAGCGLILRVRRRRGRGMLLGGLFPMVAAGFFGAVALALAALSAGGAGVPVPGGLAHGFPAASRPFPAASRPVPASPSPATPPWPSAWPSPFTWPWPSATPSGWSGRCAASVVTR